MATNYTINYDDKRFQQVEADKSTAINEMNNAYNGMINQSDQYYQAQIDAAKEYATTQQQQQQQNTDFAIEQINQQKDQANKDYKKEQAGAYVDWQKQSNQYGANAEVQAAQGLNNTGYSESSQVSMYNTYQNRVAMARESYNKAVLNYDNAIKDAQLQNNSKLAEIAYQALQTQLELSLQGFQYKNQLVLDQVSKKQELDNTYYSRYQDVLAQMNSENALAEQIRQYNQSYEMQVQEYNEQIRQFNEQMAYYREKDAKAYAMEIKQLELQREELQQRKKEAAQDYEIRKAQLEEERRQYNKSYSLKQQEQKQQPMYTDTTSNVNQNKINSAVKTIEAVRKTLGVTPLTKKSTEKATRDMIAQMYNSNKINQAEMEYLAEKYGL